MKYILGISPLFAFFFDLFSTPRWENRNKKKRK